MGVRLPKPEPIWLLNAAVAGLAFALWALVIRRYAPLQAPALPWWLLAPAVALSERFPAELEFRRSAHSFSLTDILLALALVFSSGTAAFVGIVLGGGLALALRRLPAVKLAFNIAQFALITCVAELVVRGAAGLDHGFGWWTGGGVLAATEPGGLITIALVVVAIFLTERHITRGQIRQMFGMDLLVTITSSAMALVCAILWVVRPEATPLLLIPVLVAFIGYRAYVAERQGHEKVKFLYEANRSLSESPEVAVAIEGLLARALEAFRAEQAEIILFAADGGVPLRTGLGPRDAREAMVPVDPAAAAALRALAEAADDPVGLVAPFAPQVAGYLEERGVRHAMIGLLHGKDRVIGTVMLANRFGVGRGFHEDDRALFDTLAANASAALQFDRLETAVSELRQLQDRLQHQATHDPLTGLANRALFSRQVREALDADGGEEVAVMFIDLDDFKGVNDTLGHPVGDELLKSVASRLVRSMRTGDVVARLGGDEFAVLVRHPERVERAAATLAERTLHAFSLPVSAGDRMLAVGLSIGIATSRHSTLSSAELLRDADVAMYEAKEGGKRRYAIFTPAMRDSIVLRHDLEAQLERAIERRELLVQYQPIIDLATGRTVSVEALVRWDHPDRGRIQPAEFIPLAEENGLIVPLGRYVLEEACARVSRRDPEMKVQVNLSAIELEHPDLIDTVAGVLERTGIAPERLVLEVTETLLVKDAALGGATLQQLRDLGVQLALDDFGTGYSSLSYLRSLPLDTLKIAREFVEGLAVSEHDAAFVRLIVGLAKTVGLRVVAEGIETRAQFDRLREIGCDLGQGFYFAAPLDADADWLAHGEPALSL